LEGPKSFKEFKGRTRVVNRILSRTVYPAQTIENASLSNISVALVEIARSNKIYRR